MKQKINENPFRSGYEKLINNFDFISDSLEKHKEWVTKLQGKLDNNLEKENLKNFALIIKNFIELKENFKVFYYSMVEYSNKNMMNTNSVYSDDTNNNSLNTGQTVTVKTPSGMNSKLKLTYDKIFNEFSKIDKTTKDLATIKNNIEEKRKQRVKMLEIKLQSFCEEIKNINFININKQLEDLAMTGTLNTIKTAKNLLNVNKSSNMLIENDNNMIRKYDVKPDGTAVPLDSISINLNTKGNEDIRYHSDVNYDNNLENNRNTNNHILIDQILNLNTTKGDEMIQFIESLLMKAESEAELSETIQNIKK